MALTFFVETRAQAHAGSCAKFFSARTTNVTSVIAQYSKEDFPESGMWEGKTSPNSYSEWAAQTTNRAADKFVEGQPSIEILEWIAKQRQDFQNHFEPNAEFGGWRFHQTGDYKNFIGHLSGSELVRSRWANQALVEHPALSTPGAVNRPGTTIVERTTNGTSFRFAETTYRTDAGRELRSTAIGFTSEYGYVMTIQPASTDAKLIFDDVMARVERLRRDRDRSEFNGIMHGYYNANPFLRGSASIGRIFFAALYLGTFRTCLRMTEDIDVRALISTRQRFGQLVGPGPYE